MIRSPIVLHDELIAEILSILPVKSLLQFKCVCKSWKTLISDSAFIKLHLKRSATQIPMFAIILDRLKITPGESPDGNDDEYEENFSVFPYPTRSLLDNSSITLFDDPYYDVENKECSNVFASCNGLFLLASVIFTGPHKKYSFQLWNPATKTISKKFGYFCAIQYQSFTFGLGFDDSTDTYKVVVASRYIGNQLKSNVRVLSFGDDVWRSIESFPVVPLPFELNNYNIHDGVYVSGAVNWLAIRNNIDYHSWINMKLTVNKTIKVEHFVIVSLDLRTETYNQYLLPLDFDEVPSAQPIISVLGGCLCFSYSYKETDIVIWQMKKFGVEDSWTQFLKVSYQNLQIDYDLSGYMKYHFQLIPLLLFEDCDTLMLRSSQNFEAILYNWRDNRVKQIKVTTTTKDFEFWDPVNYVESLVRIN
ncbi:F-box/kelch-repeat protein At3g23880-like [Vicia villosa]|uniref:F-box/kelch-repeat protein At3g23880-like n=1 Tax=Vicia villosa TaxID=3911 RepID=UPI00273C6760|nr:F-box/kelch-repeat protein At3g23880-like [Vicia villosa]